MFKKIIFYNYEQLFKLKSKHKNNLRPCSILTITRWRSPPELSSFYNPTTNLTHNILQSKTTENVFCKCLLYIFCKCCEPVSASF